MNGNDFAKMIGGAFGGFIGACLGIPIGSAIGAWIYWFFFNTIVVGFMPELIVNGVVVDHLSYYLCFVITLTISAPLIIACTILGALRELDS